MTLPQQRDSGSAGTPSDGYRVPAAAHPYREQPADWGARPTCVCGKERRDHGEGR